MNEEKRRETELF